MPYVALQSSADAGLPAGNNYYAKNGFLPKLNERRTSTRSSPRSSEAPTGQFVMFLESYGGAYVSACPVDATAFPNRDRKSSSC